MAANVANKLHGEEPCHFSEVERLCFVIKDFTNLGNDSDWRLALSTQVAGDGTTWGLGVWIEKESRGVVVTRSTKGTRAVVSLRSRVEHYPVKDVVFSYDNSFVIWKVSSNLDEAINEDGSLTLHVDIQFALPPLSQWQPKKQLPNKISQLWQTGEASDMEFEVKGGARFVAHRFVVGLQCPMLLTEFAEAAAKDGVIHIDNVDAELFKAFLQFIYTEKIPSTLDWEQNAYALLELADRFGCSDLKLFAEAKVVERGMDNAEEAIKALLFADGHTCALLKEAAIGKLVASLTEAKECSAWEDIKACNTLYIEILEEKLGCEKKRSVAELRNELYDKGETDLDGSKEMLIKRLKRS